MQKYWNEWTDLETLLHERYGLTITGHEEIRKIMKLKTNRGTMALKKVKASYERFLFIYEAMEHGRKMGFSNIPEVIKTIDGDGGIQQADGIYMLIRWIDGREADYENDKDLNDTTVALAKFHKAAKDFEPSSDTDPQLLWGKWIENFNSRSKEILLFRDMALAKDQKTAFDHKIIHYSDYFHDWAVRSMNHLENSGYHHVSELGRRMKTFCHHDIANHNVLLTENNEVYFIDFDYCIMDIPTHDLSSLLIRNVRYGHWDLGRAYGIINTYNGIKPIMAEEISIIKGFMFFPQEFWQAGLQYYREKQPWDQEVFNRRLDRVLDDIPKREGFMKRFFL